MLEVLSPPCLNAAVWGRWWHWLSGNTSHHRRKSPATDSCKNYLYGLPPSTPISHLTSSNAKSSFNAVTLLFWIQNSIFTTFYSLHQLPRIADNSMTFHFYLIYVTEETYLFYFVTNFITTAGMNENDIEFKNTTSSGFTWIKVMKVKRSGGFLLKLCLDGTSDSLARKAHKWEFYFFLLQRRAHYRRLLIMGLFWVVARSSH